MKVVALVDGEHYPPVTRWGIDVATASGFDVVAAIVVGGTEKLDATGRVNLGDVRVLASLPDPRASLKEAIVALRRGQWPAEQVVNPDVKDRFRW